MSKTKLNFINWSLEISLFNLIIIISKKQVNFIKKKLNKSVTQNY